MKKLIVSLLAVAGLAACATDDVVRELDNRTAIAFDTFVENATRADNVSTTTGNITEFSVWAYMNAEDGIVFNDELVSRSGDAWTYTNLQYWLAGNNYSFAAFAGDRDFVEGLPKGLAMGEEGLGTITFTNENGTNDILYAQNYVDNAAADQAPVSFQFDHLLSKVRFTFANGFANDNNKIVVKNIKMTSAEVAQLNLNTNSFVPVDDAKYVWENHVGTKTLEFGHMAAGEKVARGDNAISDEDRLVIPAGANYEYTVTFDVEVYNGEQCGLQKSMEVKVSGVELVAGHSYNFVATINQENLNLNAIEFEVAVDEWVDQVVDGGAVEGEVSFVTSAAQIQEILDNATKDVTILFGTDITDGDVNILQKEGIDVTINGNGKKFTGVFNVNGDARAAGKETLTFTGINFVASEAKTFISAPSKVNNRYNYSHNITIEGCTFTGAYDQGVEVGAASFTGAYNIVMKNCEANKMHSLLQTQSVDNTVLVENVKVVASKNGVSFGNTAFPTLRNAEIEAEFYGVRADGDASRGNLVIENSKINANQPVVVRKVTTDGYKVNVDEATELTTSGDYDVIFTAKSDDVAYVAPAKAFTFNGPADLVVFPQTVVVHTADEMAAALKSDANIINVKMANDIEVPISTIGTTASGDAKQMGGANTKNITIDLNGKKLNLTTTYWSVLGAKNSDAIVTIKNGTMTSSQPTGTWNSYDLTFSNCNYNFENVVFEKAIALEAANKSYNLKNVTINETHDYYAMWITAEGQNVTIDGLTVNSLGRGIKIDEQYVGAPAKVTLNIANATFKTANKAAILVKSVAGAEINVEGINISNVAKDTEFAVWVDEDAAAYADLVVVNGALAKVEGAKDTVASSATELAEAVQNGAKNVYLENGTYTLASYPAGLKLVGCGDNVVFDATGKKYGVHGDVTIENVEVRFANDNYTGFQHTNVEVYKNCTIVGQPFLYGADVTFEGCTFEQTSADAYNVWTYGAKAVKFVDCVFNCAGKSVLIYTESGDGQTVLFEGCTLNASAPVAGKAAIEIDSSLIKGAYNVVINDTTANGFANGSVSGNSLWNNKKGNKTTITVDGVTVL